MLKRLWRIRHLHYFWLRRGLLNWFANYQGPGALINPRDWEYLVAVWRGEI